MLAEILLHLAGLLFAFWFTTIMHELSHALFAKIEGAEIIGIYIFWHWADRETGEYRYWRPWELGKRPFDMETSSFYWGRYRYRGYVDEPRALKSLAPVLSDALIVFVAGLVLAMTHSLYPALFVVCALIDASKWVHDYYRGEPHSDGKKYRYGRKGVPNGL